MGIGSDFEQHRHLQTRQGTRGHLQVAAPGANAEPFRPSAGSQTHQHPQAVLDFCHRRWLKAAQAGEETGFADGADGLAKKERRVRESALRWLDDDVERDMALRGSEGDYDDEVGAALIEGVDRDDKHRTAPSLFMAADRIEIGEPDVAPGGRWSNGHESRRVGIETVGTRGVHLGEVAAVVGGGLSI